MDPNWALVIITAIYMFFTIGIFIANTVSACITRKQLAESKNQFEETQRLSCKPFLQMEPSLTQNTEKCFQIILPIFFEESEEFILQGCIKQFFKIKNLGNGNAINLFYEWDSLSETEIKTNIPPINAIMHGDEYGIEMLVNSKIQGRSCLTFYFNDLIGNSYYQKMYLTINGSSITIENDEPILY